MPINKNIFNAEILSGPNYIESDFTGNVNIISSTQLKEISVIPSKTKTSSVINSESGDMARDAALKAQLDNETGNYLTLESTVDQFILSLWSKTDALLSTVYFNKELPNTTAVTDKYLYIDIDGNITWKEGTQHDPGETKILYNTTAGWDASTGTVGELNTIYVYTDKYSYAADGIIKTVPGIKFGNGTNYLKDTSFITDDLRQQLEHFKYYAGRGILIDNQAKVISAKLLYDIIEED